MQSQQQLSKEELKTWKSQLKIRQLEDKDTEEALELVAESTVKLYVIFQELGITKDQCKKAFRSDFEDKLNQKNSIVLYDPSDNNKIISVRIYRDMANIDRPPTPKREDYEEENQFIKSLLNHQLMEGIYEKEYKELDYEIPIIFNVHPDYANRGLGDYMISLYVQSAYRRGVKNILSVIYSEIMMKIIQKVEGSVILKQVNVEDYEMGGKKIFKEQKNGYLVSQELSDKGMTIYGLKHLVELKNKGQLTYDEKEFFNY